LRTTNANSEKFAVDLEERTRRRAYELYERRGREAGHETEDWLQAEAELARENHAAPAETVKSNRKPPVTKSGKSNPKQVKKVEIVDAQENGKGVEKKWQLWLWMSPNKSG